MSFLDHPVNTPMESGMNVADQKEIIFTPEAKLITTGSI
jgi:hypothetical protein